MKKFKFKNFFPQGTSKDDFIEPFLSSANKDDFIEPYRKISRLLFSEIPEEELMVCLRQPKLPTRKETKLFTQTVEQWKEECEQWLNNTRHYRAFMDYADRLTKQVQFSLFKSNLSIPIVKHWIECFQAFLKTRDFHSAMAISFAFTDGSIDRLTVKNISQEILQPIIDFQPLLLHGASGLRKEMEADKNNTVFYLGAYVGAINLSKEKPKPLLEAASPKEEQSKENLSGEPSLKETPPPNIITNLQVTFVNNFSEAQKTLKANALALATISSSSSSSPALTPTSFVLYSHAEVYKKVFDLLSKLTEIPEEVRDYFKDGTDKLNNKQSRLSEFQTLSEMQQEEIKILGSKVGEHNYEICTFIISHYLRANPTWGNPIHISLKSKLNYKLNGTIRLIKRDSKQEKSEELPTVDKSLKRRSSRKSMSQLFLSYSESDLLHNKGKDIIIHDESEINFDEDKKSSSSITLS